MKRNCRNCKGPYKDHIDWVFEQRSRSKDFVAELTLALPKVTCKNYKPMSNLEYLEWLSEQRI